MEISDKIVLFENSPIRKVWHNDTYYYVINDVISVLTESKNPKDYFIKLRKRDPEMERGGQIVHPLPVETAKGLQKMNCADRKGVFRIIQSITSPKAEPFKRWLADLGEQAIEETENPELGFERLREIYLAKGYDEKWIETRLKSISIRKELTEEWQKRGVTEGVEYAYLTAEISKGAFEMTPSEHGKLKGLGKENLRDHMNNLELIVTMLGEEVTRQFTVQDDAQGFNENLETAQRGGAAAGEARRNLEKRGAIVISSDNFLKQIEEAGQKKELPNNIENTPPQ
jgi:DNA-damage-inducible protein D